MFVPLNLYILQTKEWCRNLLCQTNAAGSHQKHWHTKSAFFKKNFFLHKYPYQLTLHINSWKLTKTYILSNFGKEKKLYEEKVPGRVLEFLFNLKKKKNLVYAVIYFALSLGVYLAYTSFPFVVSGSGAVLSSKDLPTWQIPSPCPVSYSRSRRAAGAVVSTEQPERRQRHRHGG